MLPPGIHQRHQYGENQLPAPAGLHHTGDLCIFSQSIPVLDQLLLSPGHTLSPQALLPALLGHPLCQHSPGTTLLARGVLWLLITQHFTLQMF